MAEVKRIPKHVDATCPTPKRTHCVVKGVELITDEAEERGGTGQGQSPTDVIWSSLAGCTNVILNMLAGKRNVEISDLTVEVDANLDPTGIIEANKVRNPFPDATLTINAKMKGADEDIAWLKENLKNACPVSGLIISAGTDFKEVWNIEKV